MAEPLFAYMINTVILWSDQLLLKQYSRTSNVIFTGLSVSAVSYHFWKVTTRLRKI